MNNFIRQFFCPFVCSIAAAAILGCGGTSAPQNVVPQVITITADEVFGPQMIGQTWQFEGTCGGDVLDPMGNLLTTFPMQPFHATVAVQHGTAFTYTKDVDCGYWALGVKDAQLYDFALEKDADSGWYNTGGHVVMPFGCPWCDGPTDSFYTVAPAADGGPRGYQIIPPRGDDQHKDILKTEYGTTPWETDAYVETVDTPVYSGPALISEQTEGVCAHEKWYFGRGVGLVKVIAYFTPGCSGLQSEVTMVRTK